mmetsp:Transcript_7314/g.10212  ORF Transcript_7314/g.10212 Transcript_7314/m.10212 type:complete len:80 (-) Transcript_7314:10-249(-)
MRFIARGNCKNDGDIFMRVIPETELLCEKVSMRVSSHPRKAVVRFLQLLLAQVLPAEHTLLARWCLRTFIVSLYIVTAV